MTKQQFIESGILEAYLLGVISDGDQKKVQTMMTADPEIFDHLHQLDQDLTVHFQQASVPPPPAIRDLIELRSTEQSIQKKSPNASTEYDQADGYSKTTARQHYVDVEVDNTHIRVHKYWRPAFIAVFILGKIFLATGLYFYFKANSQEQEIARLKAEITHSVRK